MTTRLTLRTERLIAMEQLLFHSGTGLRAVELAEACGVDRRTVYRDLSLLNEIGVPIYQQSGRFHLNRKHYQATVRLSFDELLALILLAAPAARQSVGPHLTSALEKLSRILPHSIRSYANSLVEHTQRHPMEASQVEVLETIARAWGDRSPVRIVYASRDGAKIRKCDVSPHAIEMATSGSLQLIGYDSLSRRVRVFQLPRIRRAQRLNAGYRPPDGRAANQP